MEAACTCSRCRSSDTCRSAKHNTPTQPSAPHTERGWRPSRSRSPGGHCGARGRGRSCVRQKGPAASAVPSLKGPQQTGFAVAHC